MTISNNINLTKAQLPHQVDPIKVQVGLNNINTRYNQKMNMMTIQPHTVMEAVTLIALGEILEIVLPCHL